MEDFDFDTLLGDIDESEVKEAVEAVQEEIIEEVTEIEVPEVDDLNDALDDLLDEVATPEVVPEPVQETAPEVKVTQVETLTYETSGIEFAEETKNYIKESLSIEMRKQALNAEMKVIKNDYADQGVDIGTANKAMKALSKELKESAEEAAAIERVKDMFRADDGIYTDIVGLNQ